jgi:hypothetical protein
MHTRCSAEWPFLVFRDAVGQRRLFHRVFGAGAVPSEVPELAARIGRLLQKCKPLDASSFTPRVHVSHGAVASGQQRTWLLPVHLHVAEWIDRLSDGCQTLAP